MLQKIKSKDNERSLNLRVCVCVCVQQAGSLGGWRTQADGLGLPGYNNTARGMKAAAATHTHKHTRTTQNHISPNPRLAHHHHPHTPALPLNLGWHKTALENMCVCLKAMPLVLFHQPVTPVVALANMCIWHGNAIADAAGFWSGWARRAFPHCLLIFFAFCLRPPGNFQRLYSVKAQRISHVSVTLERHAKSVFISRSTTQKITIPWINR